MIQWFAQEHPAACVAACLRMVLSGFGPRCTEQEIRELLGNPR
jgi:peptidase C39-like protein